jgi:DNA-binding NarL/FixJ family response regulator
MHILYIDDDQVDRMAFARLIKRYTDYSCDCVASLQEGNKNLLSNSYQAIITDHNLRDGDAFDILKQFDLPVIVTSGIHDEELTDRLYQAGAAAFLLKPISAYDLQEAVKNISSPKKNTLPDNQVFNLTYLHELSDGDQEFEQEMIGIYLEEVPEALKALKAHFAQASWVELANGIHKMRSKIRILGLEAAMGLSVEIENALKQGLNNQEIQQKTKTLFDMMESSLHHAKSLQPRNLSN